MIRDLREVGTGDVALVGGKAASLGAMLQAGLPVPPGFVVTIEGYHAGMTSELEEAVYAAFDTLGVERVAVRSSAVAEDSSDASWAGQLESYLNTTRDDLVEVIEECWQSINTERAQRYADDHDVDEAHRAVGVVVQAMVDSEIAGVIFTANPVTQSREEIMIEAVYGLGEMLVQGRVTPESIIANRQGEILEHNRSMQDVKLVYKDGLNQEEPVEVAENVLSINDISKLVATAQKIEEYYQGKPQDIEWAIADGELYIVQSRPITTLQPEKESHALGEPEDLFFWGPSRAQPMYMSDFMTAVERLFVTMAQDPILPDPPRTLVLFNDNKMVWLSNAQEFNDFTEQVFRAYEQLDRLDDDIAHWRKAVEQLDQLHGEVLDSRLVEAWYATEFAEFSLYGAETTLIKKLSRFDAETRQKIWGAFTVPSMPTFLARIDAELAETRDPVAMAKKYPWIENGYHGVVSNELSYFEKRLEVVKDPLSTEHNLAHKQAEIIDTFGLTEDEIKALRLACALAEFMDERKAFMMETRRLITHSVGRVEHGWYFENGLVALLSQQETYELWQRYVGFKASSSTIIGIVASKGTRHFVNGEVVLVTEPTQHVEDGKILIVPSTSPSYVPLMRKAKALVTDHGGMMSHAAIVARELNLPCVVGTRNATRIFKDGEMVVVNTITGEVRLS